MTLFRRITESKPALWAWERMTLVWANHVRASRWDNVPPLTEMPKGLWADARHCPVANATLMSTGSLPHPFFVERFIVAFDHGCYPQLEEGRVFAEPAKRTLVDTEVLARAEQKIEHSLKPLAAKYIQAGPPIEGFMTFEPQRAEASTPLSAAEEGRIAFIAEYEQRAAERRDELASA